MYFYHNFARFPHAPTFRSHSFQKGKETRFIGKTGICKSVDMYRRRVYIYLSLKGIFQRGTYISGCEAISFKFDDASVKLGRLLSLRASEEVVVRCLKGATNNGTISG